MNMTRVSSLAVIFVLACGFFSGHAKEPSKPRVQFFLVNSRLTPAQLLAEPLDKIKLQKRPIFTSDDLEDYRIETHSFLLNDDAFKRLAGLDVSPKGRAFVATVDKEPVYLGAFLNPQASVPFKGVVIALPKSGQPVSTMRIELGYPNKSFFKGTDPRSDPRVIAILEPLQTNKIKEPLRANSLMMPSLGQR